MGPASNVASKIVRKIKEVYAKLYCPEVVKTMEVISDAEVVNNFLNWSGIYKDLFAAMIGGVNVEKLSTFLRNAKVIGKSVKGVLVTTELTNNSIFNSLALPVVRIKGLSTKTRGYFVDWEFENSWPFPSSFISVITRLWQTC